MSSDAGQIKITMLTERKKQYAQCSTCGHRSIGWTYPEAQQLHLKHMAEAHPEIKLGTVLYVL